MLEYFKPPRLHGGQDYVARIRNLFKKLPDLEALSSNTSVSKPRTTRDYLVESVKIAAYSPDPRTQVGAILVDPDTGLILAAAHNAFPPGMKSRPEWWQDRTEKHLRVIHAEVGALAECSCNWHSPDRMVLYSHYAACSVCCKTLLAFGVAKIVNWAPALERARQTPWYQDIEKGLGFFQESGGVVETYPDPLDAGIDLRFDGELWRV